MAWYQDLVRGLGTQNAPFGFGPDVSPSQGAVDPAYNAGMQMIGNVGMGMLASGESNPMRALGRSYLVAQNNAQEQNRNQYIAAEMMSAAEEKKQKRQEEAEAKKQRDAFIATLPADVRMKAMSIPGYLDSYIEATDPNLQQPSEPKRYEVGNNLVDADGNIIYQGQGDSNVSAQIAERQAAAQSLGLDPNDPAYKSFVLTGKMPREDQAPLTATDKKAILEADDSVLANETVIGQLESILAPDETGTSLNDRADYGVTANTQSWLARNDPTGFFDDAKGGATTELNNVILGQALSSLKSIFGAAPTEGERKILVDLQASVDKTPDERKRIINRAIGLAKIRLTYNKQRADGLRGQTYYKPGAGQTGSVGTVPDGVTPQEWNAMTPEERSAWQ